MLYYKVLGYLFKKLTSGIWRYSIMEHMACVNSKVLFREMYCILECRGVQVRVHARVKMYTHQIQAPP